VRPSQPRQYSTTPFPSVFIFLKPIVHEVVTAGIEMRMGDNTNNTKSFESNFPKVKHGRTHHFSYADLFGALFCYEGC